MVLCLHTTAAGTLLTTPLVLPEPGSVPSAGRSGGAALARCKHHHFHRELGVWEVAISCTR